MPQTPKEHTRHCIDFFHLPTDDDDDVDLSLVLCAGSVDGDAH